MSSNQLLTTSMIMRESLRILANDLTFTAAVNKEYSPQFGKTGAKIGAVVNARKPPRYVGRSGQALQIEGSVENYVPITLTTQYGVDISFSSADFTLSIDDFSERFLKPAMETIANKIDVDGLNLFLDVNNFAGTAGDIVNNGPPTLAKATTTIMAARRKLTENGCPQADRVGVIGPATEANLVPQFTGQFNPQAQISGIFKRGALGENVFGFNWAADANVASFTPQTGGTLAAISSVPASGATTVAVTGTADTSGVSITVPRGTVFTIAGVYAINPQNRQSTGQLLQFVVTADTTLTASGTSLSGTLPIYPAYIPASSGVTPQFATCYTPSTVSSTAATTLLTGAKGTGPYQQNIAYHPDAFTFASADLVLPTDGVMIAERDNWKGISMRMIQQYDINSDMMPVRFDVLYGWKTIYPELAVRITG